jgi:ATP-dependent DNA helicase RecQ
MSKILIDKAKAILKEFWGFDSFYLDQEQIITAILKGENTISLVPTGGGKSLCFQIPALIKDGTCIVISPLIALIEDQISRLKSLNIPAEGVHSGQDPKIQNEILHHFTSGHLKMLYISPERLQTESFRSFLNEAKISFIAIDEAHCISQWGYDFRPEYRKISNIREIFPEIQMCAFTATANIRTLHDMKSYLGLGSFTLFRSSFLKHNIRFGIIHSESKLKILSLLIKEFQGSGIIYMRSRNGTEILSTKLNSQGYKTMFYHAGMSTEDRKYVQDKWLFNETRIIVSTTAFGMGIDKPDVRFVIHYDLPTSMEEYYQEAGRAGRDGKISDAVIIYHKKDLLNMKQRDIDSFPDIKHIDITYHNLITFSNVNFRNQNEIKLSFDLANFVKKNSISKVITVRSIIELERYGFIAFNINPKHSHSKLKINLNEYELDELRSTDETKFNLLKTIILNTNNIFAIKQTISEKEISILTGYDFSSIRKHLNEMADLGQIEYTQGNQNIQIIFKNYEYIQINHNELEFRKKRLIRNYNTIKTYLEFGDCRQKYVLKYFDEKLRKKCGICDICLNSKEENYTQNEFKDYSERIEDLLSSGWAEMEDLIYLGTYLKRHKNKQMLKIFLKKGDFQILGNKILKDIQR